jgi:hypothetical protein
MQMGLRAFWKCSMRFMIPPVTIEVACQQRTIYSMAYTRTAVCRALIVTLLALPVQAHSELLRDVPQSPSRPELVLQLEALGVPAAEAAKRVEALTDEEVASLAEGVREAPAGGGLMCFSCFAKLLLLAIPIAAIGYLIFNLLSGTKAEQAEPEKDSAPPQPAK